MCDIPVIPITFCRPKMKSLLQNGTTLIVDRYSFSGVAFSGAKQVKIKLFCYHLRGTKWPNAIVIVGQTFENDNLSSSSITDDHWDQNMIGCKYQEVDNYKTSDKVY